MHFTKAKGILSQRNYINIYRGCTHGCIYCDARSKCYDMQHDFQDIEVKSNAPELLEEALRRKRQKCVIGTGYMSDSYMPCEEKLRFTRKCLEIINKYGFGLTIQTKSDLILRDLDLLKEINERSTCVIQMTLTAGSNTLSEIIEPGVCNTGRRFQVLRTLKENNIDTVVWFTPIIPYITDNEENIDILLDYCKRAEVKGIICDDIGMTLREGNREYFYVCLEKSFPHVLKKYLKQYNSTYNCVSKNSELLKSKISSFCKDNRVLLDDAAYEFTYKFVDKSAGRQLSLF